MTLNARPVRNFAVALLHVGSINVNQFAIAVHVIPAPQQLLLVVTVVVQLFMCLVGVRDVLVPLVAQSFACKYYFGNSTVSLF